MHRSVAGQEHPNFAGAGQYNDAVERPTYGYTIQLAHYSVDNIPSLLPVKNIKMHM